LERSARGSWKGTDEKQRKRWLRSGKVPADYPDPVAADYPDCLQIVRERVKPQRDKVRRKAHRKYWWHYGDKRPQLYASISSLDRTLVTAIVSKYVNMVFQPTDIVFMHKISIFPFDKDYEFALLQSSFHSEWAWQYSSTMGATTINYSSTDCFETFPFPAERQNQLDVVGKKYLVHRAHLMLERGEGLTDTYNRFHDPNDKDADIESLRFLHIQMDKAVAAAYGWQDLDLGHDFHETTQGIRYNISDAARRQVLTRLLKLNHHRYEEEVRQGLHEKAEKKRRKKAKRRKKRKQNEGQLSLF
jgi:hypothetical protein